MSSCTSCTRDDTTYDPGPERNSSLSEGWIGGPITAVFVGGPLIGVAAGLRSTKRTLPRGLPWPLLLACLVTFVLVMQLLDPNETTGDRLGQGLGVRVYLLAFAVEVPAFTHRWPSSSLATPR